MEEHWGCGASVAKLSNRQRKTIGWVIQWENSELSVLWLGDDYDAAEINPPLTRKTLDAAKSVRTDETTRLLEELSTRNEMKMDLPKHDP